MASETFGRGLKVAVQALAAAALATGVLTAQAAPVSGQGTWETTLQARDLDGDPATIEAWYDTVLDLLWLDVDPGPMGYSLNDAVAWAAGLNVGGLTGWQLPTIADTGEPVCSRFSYSGTDCGYNVDTSGSALAHLYYVTLGNLADYDTSGNLQAGWGLTNTGPFQSLTSDGWYWSRSENGPDSAWVFLTDVGLQAPTSATDPGGCGGNTFCEEFLAQNVLTAIAVRPGDVATAVAEPQSLALALLGLGALWVTRRRRPH